MEQSVTDFDTLTFSHRTQMLKAALPYMDNRNQKNLVLFIKFWEMRNAMSLLQKEDSQLRACSDEDDESRMLHMLNDIRQFCNDKEREFIDMFLNFSQAMQLFSSYRNVTPDSKDNNSMMDMLRTMLSPEQQTMFETYSQMLSSTP